MAKNSVTCSSGVGFFGHEKSNPKVVVSGFRQRSDVPWRRGDFQKCFRQQRSGKGAISGMFDDFSSNDEKNGTIIIIL